MTTAGTSLRPVIGRRELRVGALVAEGGEGRVYEVTDRPDQVYKAYRAPHLVAPLGELVTWPISLAHQAPNLATRVRSSTSWPLAVVAEGEEKGASTTAAGLLLPRAPRRFSLRHRDGQSHLASLSYLTADPARRTEAYGVGLPAAGSPERWGLVYALARLLEAFEWSSPHVSHGDLSAKNVLWSLARGPEIFVLDCDNAERYEGDEPLGPPGRRRAMTPNWDDPAVPSGSNPGVASDRYSLALIFLRVVGAAHFPLQKRQKEGKPFTLEFDIPATGRKLPSLGPDAPFWRLCSEGLSVADPARRPPAGAWVAALGAIIEELGASRILDAVGAAQGQTPAPPKISAPSDPDPLGQPPDAHLVVGEVIVRPVAAAIRPRAANPLPVYRSVGADGGRLRAIGRPLPTGLAPGGAVSGGSVSGGLVSGGSVSRGRAVARPAPAVAWRTQLRRALLSFFRWLVGEHQRTLGYLRTAGQRGRGLARVPWCLLLDGVVVAVSLFLIAMIVSPFLGV